MNKYNDFKLIKDEFPYNIAKKIHNPVRFLFLGGGGST